MEQYNINSTFLCWKEVGTHFGTLNSSLRMGFAWLMDTNKMTIFNNKKSPKNLRVHIHQFSPFE